MTIIAMTIRRELDLFISVLERTYQLHSGDYPMISDIDMCSFRDRITYISDNDLEIDMLYDPLMESLVQSSMAHFLYIKKYNLDIDQTFFHPNYIRFDFMDKLIQRKAAIKLSSFQYYEILPGTSAIDISKLSGKVDALVDNPVLKQLVDPFVKKLQVGDDQVDKMIEFVKSTRSNKKKGLIYYILMDLYLEHIDSILYKIVKESSSNFFWERCLNCSIIGFTDKKSVVEFQSLCQFSHLLPAWGLTAKVRTGKSSGRICRPWGGKLYIKGDGVLRWERPESIIQ